MTKQKPKNPDGGALTFSKASRRDYHIVTFQLKEAIKAGILPDVLTEWSYETRLILDVGGVEVAFKVNRLGKNWTAATRSWPAKLTAPISGERQVSYTTKLVRLG